VRPPSAARGALYACIPLLSIDSPSFSCYLLLVPDLDSLRRRLVLPPAKRRRWEWALPLLLAPALWTAVHVNHRPQPATLPRERPRPRYVNGIVDFDGARYRVGEPGDQVVAGDWDCDGTLTLALYRPRTGDVFRFDRTADNLTISATTRVTGGTRAQARDLDADGCDEIVVDRPTGPPAVIRASASATRPRSPAAARAR